MRCVPAVRTVLAVAGSGFLVAVSAWTGQVHRNPTVTQFVPSFSTQPTDTQAGEPIAVAIDVFGTTGTAALTISPGTGAPGAQLSAPDKVPLIASAQSPNVMRATFDNVVITTAGVGYTLTGTVYPDSGTPISTTSDPFDVTAAPATRLAFASQPVRPAESQTITPAVVVQALDDFGNVSGGASHEVTVTLNGGPSTGSLGGTTRRVTTDGVATFEDLQVTGAGDGFRLVATAPELQEAVSAPFTVAALQPRLSFRQQPVHTKAGSTMAPVVVQVVDEQGQPVSDWSGAVTLSIRAADGARLRGTTTVVASGGLASFTDCRIDRAGTGYRLVATAAGLNPAVSEPFDIATPTSARWWWVLLAAILVLAAGGMAAVLLRRSLRRRAARRARPRVITHPDAGTIYVDSDDSRSHSLRLEPHPDIASPGLTEQR